MWQVTPNTWHVTCDTWHVTCDLFCPFCLFCVGAIITHMWRDLVSPVCGIFFYFHWIGPLGRFSHRVCLCVCVCVCEMTGNQLFFCTIGFFNPASICVKKKLWQLAQQKHRVFVICTFSRNEDHFKYRNWKKYQPYWRWQRQQLIQEVVHLSAFWNLIWLSISLV